MIGEYNTTNVLQRRYVFGPGADEPLVWYEGSGTTDRRWLHADERGSITAISNGSGAALAINSYDEYGMPAVGNTGRFQYTGQMWLSQTSSPSSGLYHYKARAYSPRLGRFMQTDPIGYADGMNLYAYVGNDPVNATDPSGTDAGYPVVTGLGRGGGWDFSSLQYLDNFPPVILPSPIGEGSPDSDGGENYPGFPVVTATKKERTQFAATGTLAQLGPVLLSTQEPQGKADNEVKSQQCSLLIKVSDFLLDRGDSITDAAPFVIGAGIFLKNPQLVATGEVGGLLGAGFQAIGATGRLFATGDRINYSLDMASALSGFLSSQSRAREMALGLSLGKATDTAKIGRKNRGC